MNKVQFSFDTIKAEFGQDKELFQKTFEFAIHKYVDIDFNNMEANPNDFMVGFNSVYNYALFLFSMTKYGIDIEEPLNLFDKNNNEILRNRLRKMYLEILEANKDSLVVNNLCCYDYENLANHPKSQKVDVCLDPTKWYIEIDFGQDLQKYIEQVMKIQQMVLTEVINTYTDNINKLTDSDTKSLAKIEKELKKDYTFDDLQKLVKEVQEEFGSALIMEKYMIIIELFSEIRFCPNSLAAVLKEEMVNPKPSEEGEIGQIRKATELQYHYLIKASRELGLNKKDRKYKEAIKAKTSAFESNMVKIIKLKNKDRNYIDKLYDNPNLDQELEDLINE